MLGALTARAELRTDREVASTVLAQLRESRSPLLRAAAQELTTRPWLENNRPYNSSQPALKSPVAGQSPCSFGWRLVAIDTESEAPSELVSNGFNHEVRDLNRDTLLQVANCDQQAIAVFPTYDRPLEPL